MNFARQRVENELRLHFMDKPVDNLVRIIPNNEDVMNLKGIITGVPGTPWEGGSYELEINIPPNYPYEAPKVRFLTRIWHPYISPWDGSLCLQDSDNRWPIPMSIYKTLLVIQSWMTNFEEKEPLDMAIFAQAKNSKEIFEKTAKFWAIKYGNVNGPIDQDLERKVQILAKHTKDIDSAVVALSYRN
ncbi:unnamed protein product [Caenorhabditis brenneri]